MNINAIVSVLDKRQANGTNDKTLIKYLEHLKTIHSHHCNHKALDGLIDAIKQTPANSILSKAAGYSQ